MKDYDIKYIGNPHTPIFIEFSVNLRHFPHATSMDNLGGTIFEAPIKELNEARIIVSHTSHRNYEDESMIFRLCVKGEDAEGVLKIFKLNMETFEEVRTIEEIVYGKGGSVKAPFRSKKEFFFKYEEGAENRKISREEIEALLIL